MNRIKFVIICCLVLSGCSTRQTLTPLTPQVLQLAEGQTLLIQLNEGAVEVARSESEQIEVDGQAFFPGEDAYKVISTKDQLQIAANYDGRKSPQDPISLQVRVPNGVKVKIDTEFASIVVHDYTGELEAASVSGDIWIQKVNGMITARSNRGDVKVEDSGGKVSVVGNYGLLSFEDISGETGASTIMGTITFSGPIHAQDAAHLETDHGPIIVYLSPDSSLWIQVHSTSGDVACLLPGLTSSLRMCEGLINSGEGTLTIRTVSGAVTLQMIR